MNNKGEGLGTKGQLTIQKVLVHVQPALGLLLPITLEVLQNK